MKTVITWAIIISIVSALEFIFGINDTGGKIALVLLCWSSMSIPCSLFLGQVIEAGSGRLDDDELYTGI